MIKKVEHVSRLQFIQETVTVFFSKVNFALRCSNKRPSFFNLDEINETKKYEMKK